MSAIFRPGSTLKHDLNNQVAACQVFLAIIGPNWLDAKDEAGQHRLHHPDDFVAIEIAAALARNICIIPVLVDGARMPKESWLPDSLKPLARRQAVEVRQLHFDRDAEALVERVREALNGGSVGLRSRRGTAVAGRGGSGRAAPGRLDWAPLDGHFSVAALGGDARGGQCQSAGRG